MQRSHRRLGLFNLSITKYGKEYLRISCKGIKIIKSCCYISVLAVIVIVESLKGRRWLRCLCYLYKIASTKIPPYLSEILPLLQRSQRNPECFKPLRCSTELFQNSFLLFTISEWNKLNLDVRNSDTYSLFRKNLLAFIRPIENSLYSIYGVLGIKLLHRFFSYLCEYKFKHNFEDIANPSCSCSLEIERTEHFFLRCHNYVTFRTTLMNGLNSINSKFNTLESDRLVGTILYGDKTFDNDSSLKISNKLNDLTKLFTELMKFVFAI